MIFSYISVRPFSLNSIFNLLIYFFKFLFQRRTFSFPEYHRYYRNKSFLGGSTHFVSPRLTASKNCCIFLEHCRYSRNESNDHCCASLYYIGYTAQQWSYFNLDNVYHHFHCVKYMLYTFLSAARW